MGLVPSKLQNRMETLLQLAAVTELGHHHSRRDHERRPQPESFLRPCYSVFVILTGIDERPTEGWNSVKLSAATGTDSHQHLGSSLVAVPSCWPRLLQSVGHSCPYSRHRK